VKLRPGGSVGTPPPTLHQLSKGSPVNGGNVQALSFSSIFKTSPAAHDENHQSEPPAAKPPAVVTTASAATTAVEKVVDEAEEKRLAFLAGW